MPMLKFLVIYVFIFNMEAYLLSISYQFQFYFVAIDLHFQGICFRNTKLDTFGKSTFSEFFLRSYNKIKTYVLYVKQNKQYAAGNFHKVGLRDLIT